MKTIFIKALLFLIISALAGTFMGEAVYANNHKDCSCCAVNKCHSNDKCHTTPKVCICIYQIPQLCLSKSDALPAPILTGYLVKNARLAYFYLSIKDIFHPPKA